MSEALAAKRGGSTLRWLRRIDWVFLVVGIVVTFVLFDVLFFVLSWLFVEPPVSGGQKDLERWAGWSDTVFLVAEFSALLIGAFATGFLARRGRGLATATALGLIAAVPFVIGEPLVAPLVVVMAVLVGWVGAELRGLRTAGKAG